MIIYVKPMRGNNTTPCISEDVKVNSGLKKTVAFTFTILRKLVVDTLQKNRHGQTFLIEGDINVLLNI